MAFGWMVTILSQSLCIVQLDGSEVQRATCLVNVGGSEVTGGIVEDAYSDKVSGKLLSFSRFVGLLVQGLKNEFLTLLWRLECRKRGKDIIHRGKMSPFLRSRFKRVMKAEVLH